MTDTAHDLNTLRQVHRDCHARRGNQPAHATEPRSAVHANVPKIPCGVSSWPRLIRVAVVLAVMVISAVLIAPPMASAAPDSRWDDLAGAAAHVDAQHFEAAIAAYKQIIKRDAGFAEAYSGLGHALVGAERYDDAKAAYTKSIELGGGSGALLGRGWVRWLTRDLEGAASDYRALIRIEPENCLFAVELARVLFELDRPLDVASMWKNHRSDDPAWCGARVRRVQALERAAAWSVLRDELPPMLAEFEADAHIHYLLGVALNESGDHLGAKTQLQRAVQLVRGADPVNKVLLEQYGRELVYALLWGGDASSAENWRRELETALR